LTAGHVLDDLAAKNEASEVVLGQPPYSHLTFVVRKRAPNVDIALLQLTQADALKNLRPLDIALEAPDYDASLFVMGYPQYGQQKQIILRSGSVRVSAYPPSGLIEITHTTAGGNSGGPLIDGFGDAVATCQEEIAENQVGRYLPLMSFEDVLDQIPVSPRMQNIEKGLVGGTTGLDDLKQLLKKTNTNGPTNLELYTWTHHLSSSPSSLQKIAKYLRCPLMPALVERHIPDAILPFAASLQSDQVGAVKVALAEREYILGHNTAAAQLARESLSALPPNNPSTASPLREKALLLGWAIEQQGQLGGAQVVRQDAVPVEVTLDSGVVEKYLVQWLGTVGSSKVEEGHPAEPLKGWFTDTRQCHWSIQSEVLRKVYYIDHDGQVSTDDAVSKVFSSGYGNKGSDFILTQLRPENCNDAAPRYASDLGNAHSAVADRFSTVIVEDRARLVNELSALPHVANVKLPPSKGQI
jgi:hypothetical protein